MEKRVSLSSPGKEGHGILSAAQNGRRIRASSQLTDRVGNPEECDLPWWMGSWGGRITKTLAMSLGNT